MISGYSDYPSDMRNPNSSIKLWQIQSSDYPTDMRNSITHKDLWPKPIFLWPGRVRAPPTIAHHSSRSGDRRVKAQPKQRHLRGPK